MRAVGRGESERHPHGLPEEEVWLDLELHEYEWCEQQARRILSLPAGRQRDAAISELRTIVELKHLLDARIREAGADD
jgi:hypothetical protein